MAAQEILDIGRTVYFLGYDNKLESGEIIGYSFDLNSDYYKNHQSFKLSYSYVSRTQYLGTIGNIDATKAFPSKELLLRNLQADILDVAT